MLTRPRPIALAVTALGLALLADALLRGAAWGINVELWALALAGAGLWLTPRERLTRTDKALAGLALLFALLFSLRDSDALKAANLLALAFCLGALALPASVRGLREASMGRLLCAPFVGPVALTRDFAALAKETAQERKATPEASQRGQAIFRGLLLATPLILVFGGLFASADAVFRSKVESLGNFDLDFDAVNAHFWTLLFALPFAGGLLYRLARREESYGPERAAPTRGFVGATEIGIVLGSLVVLFGAFLAIQFRYLFGGSATIQSIPGMTYTQYARSGFFELVWVAFLAFVVLLGADALLRRERPSDEVLYRTLGRVLATMVSCVIVSAMMRMKLYTDASGLTELRLYSSVFMLWLTLAFGWLLATALSGRPQRLAFGLLVSGLGVILATNLANPDALIVRTNLGRSNTDFEYLQTLGDDATLALANAASTIVPAQRVPIASYVRKRKDALARSDRRELNLTRLLLSRSK